MYLLKYSNRNKNIFTMKICGLTLFGILMKTSKETTTPKKRPSEGGLSTQFTTKPGIQSRWVLSWNVDFKVLLTKAMMVILHHSSSGSKVYSNSVQMFFCMKQFWYNPVSSRILTSSFRDLVVKAIHMLPGLISQQLEIMFRFASSITPIFMMSDFQGPHLMFPTSLAFLVLAISPPCVLERYWELFLTTVLFIKLPHLLAVLPEFSKHPNLPGTVEVCSALIMHTRCAHLHSPVQRVSLSDWNNDCQTGWTKFCSRLSLCLFLSLIHIHMHALVFVHICTHANVPIMFYAYKYAYYNI